MKLPRLSRKQKIAVLIITVFLAAGGAYALTRNTDTITNITKQEPERFYSRLTGEEISKDGSEEPIIGVMIENSEEARPQTGLDSAGIVFETVTEAGITRYLALYQEDKPEEIGPVRSVRSAFVDWAMGFDVAVAHVGGSEAALEMLDDRDSKTLNQFYNDGPYYRRSDRAAPHNMYVRVAELIALLKEKKFDSAEFDELQFADDTPAAPPAVTRIAIRFSSPVFTAGFTFDTESNRYLRELAGAPHTDAATNQQISVKNLIVLKGDIQNGSLGRGTGDFYKNGEKQPIRWEQKEYSSRIMFTDESGDEIRLNRGDTWIAVVPSSGSWSDQ